MTPRHILIVDDSDNDLLYTQIVLERAGQGFEVQTAETAPEALALLGSAEGLGIGLILLDINMPGMSGFEFLDAFEALPAAHRRPAVVVMLSSSPHPDDRERARRYASVRDYLTKPIDLASAAGLARWFAP